jgi:cytochrome c-type biogenesis protein CcmF
MLAWKRGDLYGVAQRLMGAVALAAIGMAAAFAFYGGPILAPFAFGLGLFVMAGAAADIVERVNLFRQPLRASLARAAGLPRSTWGTAIAHFGVGVCLLGIVGETGWSSERIEALKPQASIAIRGYDLTFDGVSERQGPNYRELSARFTVRQRGEVVGNLEPSKRSFPARETSTTEAALMTRGVSQLYLSLGDPGPDGSIAVRLYYKPLVLMIWLGALVMAMGGVLSLSDRRLRVGAPKPAKVRAALQPAE